MHADVRKTQAEPHNSLSDRVILLPELMTIQYYLQQTNRKTSIAESCVRNYQKSSFSRLTMPQLYQSSQDQLLPVR